MIFFKFYILCGIVPTTLFWLDILIAKRQLLHKVSLKHGDSQKSQPSLGRNTKSDIYSSVLVFTFAFQVPVHFLLHIFLLLHGIALLPQHCGSSPWVYIVLQTRNGEQLFNPYPELFNPYPCLNLGDGKTGWPSLGFCLWFSHLWPKSQDVAPLSGLSELCSLRRGWTKASKQKDVSITCIAKCFYHAQKNLNSLFCYL